MSAQESREYLAARVKTASSAQLHLMLIEGAIRFGREAEGLLEANDVDAASPPLLRAIDVVSELLAGVKHSEDELNVKLAALYQFAFTRLTMAYVNTSREHLAEALGVLDYERETWRQACNALAVTPEASAEPSSGPHRPVPLPAADLTSGGGLSVEA